MNIFSLDLNNYFAKPLHKMCLESWYIWKESYPKIDKVIVFNEQSKEYLDFLDFISQFDNSILLSSEPQFIADLFRLFILARYEDFLWLDGDMFVEKTASWDLPFYFFSTWNILYNGKNLEFFSKLLHNILANFIANKGDEYWTIRFKLPANSFFELNCQKYFSYFKHLHPLDLDQNTADKLSIIMITKENQDKLARFHDILAFLIRNCPDRLGLECGSMAYAQLQALLHTITPVTYDSTIYIAIWLSDYFVDNLRCYVPDILRLIENSSLKAESNLARLVNTAETVKHYYDTYIDSIEPLYKEDLCK